MIKKKDIVKHILTGERMLVLRFMPEGKLVEVRLSDYRNEYFNLWELEKVGEKKRKIATRYVSDYKDGTPQYSDIEVEL